MPETGEKKQRQRAPQAMTADRVVAALDSQSVTRDVVKKLVDADKEAARGLRDKLTVALGENPS